MTTGKTIALTRRTFLGKVMSLLFNKLSRLVITYLPRSKHLLISWLQSPSAVILEPKKYKVWHCFHCFPIYFPWSDGTGCHIFVFWMLSFKPTFSLSSSLSSRISVQYNTNVILPSVSFQVISELWGVPFIFGSLSQTHTHTLPSA